jgi:hypothetical protein
MYYIQYTNGSQEPVYRVRGNGQLHWGWRNIDGNEVLATHLSCAKDYANEVGGKFVTVKRQGQPARSGYPTGLAKLLSVR